MRSAWIGPYVLGLGIGSFGMLMWLTIMEKFARKG